MNNSKIRKETLNIRHSAKEKMSGKMTWIVVPHGSSTESNMSDSLLTSTEENPLDDHDIFIIDDEESDYCIINKETTERSDVTDGNVLLSPNVTHAESSGAVVKSTFCCTPFDCSGESKKHTSADGANYYYLSIKDDMVELQYEIDLRQAKNFEIKHVRADGNCLFSAVASQVYGNSDIYDLTRQTCVSFMEQNQKLFSRIFIEDFASYCMRKRNDKVYGVIIAFHALAHAYNCPIHIHSYSTESVNVVHPPCDGNSTPIRLSYHLGNHYNSLVELPNEYPIGGFQAGSPAKVTKNAEHLADDQWINNVNLDSSIADLIAAFLASEAGAETEPRWKYCNGSWRPFQHGRPHPVFGI